MNEPLELTVYPLLDKVGRRAERGYIVNREPIESWYVDNYQIFEKRLTPPELAAEYWRKNGDFESCAEGYTTANDGYTFAWEGVEASRLNTVRRFATCPHYDEAAQ